MKTTTIAIVNAIKAGIEANFAPTDQEAELEKASEYFLDLAMSLEMQAELITDETKADRSTRYSNLLGEIGWALDQERVEA